jgi:hypothetical protein
MDSSFRSAYSNRNHAYTYQYQFFIDCFLYRSGTDLPYWTQFLLCPLLQCEPGYIDDNGKNRAGRSSHKRSGTRQSRSLVLISPDNTL